MHLSREDIDENFQAIGNRYSRRCRRNDGSAADLNGTLKKIHDSGSISLGVRETSIPFSYQDDKQAYQGYSVDLCLKVAQHVQKELGLASLKVAYTPDTAATRIPLLTNG